MPKAMRVKINQPKHLEENLIFLVFSSNQSCANVVDKKPEGLTINLSDCTWEFESKRYRIGEARHFYPGQARYGIIGVFDRICIVHLNRIAFKLHELFARRSSLLDD